MTIEEFIKRVIYQVEHKKELGEIGLQMAIEKDIKTLVSDTLLKAIGEIEMGVAKCENIELPGYPDTYIKMADVLHILDKVNIEKELGIKV